MSCFNLRFLGLLGFSFLFELFFGSEVLSVFGSGQDFQNFTWNVLVETDFGLWGVRKTVHSSHSNFVRSLMSVSWLDDFPDIGDDIKRDLASVSDDLSSSDSFSRSDNGHSDFLRESEAVEGTALEDQTKRRRLQSIINLLCSACIRNLRLSGMINIFDSSDPLIFSWAR